MYYEGIGIEKDVNEAFKCYKRAVELGNDTVYPGEILFSGFLCGFCFNIAPFVPP